MDEAEKIIEAVRQREVLWNLQNKNYKNIKIKAKEWKAVSEQLDIPIDTVKKKWRCLRDAYARKLKPKISGQGAEEEEPAGKYACLLEFLRDHLKPRTTIGNFSQSPGLGLDESTAEEVLCSPTPMADDSEEVGGVVSAPTTPDLPTTSSRRKRTNIEESLISTMSCVQQFIAIPRPPQSIVLHSPMPTPTPAQTEDELFCSSLVQKLATFPLQIKNTAKLEMLRYLNDLELQIVRHNEQ